jgi:hypothetical protein
MYAYAVKSENVVDDFTLPPYDEHKQEEFHYWRKHHDLHGWMERLYQEKGGEKQFNCQPIRLYEKDLTRLETAVRHNQLPPTTGFFFGNNQPDEDSIANDLTFINNARTWIADGYAVYYDSWW